MAYPDDPTTPSPFPSAGGFQSGFGSMFGGAFGAPKAAPPTGGYFSGLPQTGWPQMPSIPPMPQGPSAPQLPGPAQTQFPQVQPFLNSLYQNPQAALENLRQQVYAAPAVSNYFGQINGLQTQLTNAYNTSPLGQYMSWFAQQPGMGAPGPQGTPTQYQQPAQWGPYPSAGGPSQAPQAPQGPPAAPPAPPAPPASGPAHQPGYKNPAEPRPNINVQPGFFPGGGAWPTPPTPGAPPSAPHAPGYKNPMTPPTVMPPPGFAYAFSPTAGWILVPNAY